MSEEWPDYLDALAASGDHHVILVENERIRMLETKIRPGEKTAVHTHCWWAGTYIICWSDCIRRDEKDVVLWDSRQNTSDSPVGKGGWLAPLGPHSLENVGETLIHIIQFEVKP